jgi:GT2 family glycosyltransferase/SAM-dependent methyltransferase
VPSSTVIIPVYNRASLTRQCLNIVLAGTYRFGRPQIIVVDDASTDVTPSLLAEYQLAVQSIRQPANSGFAACCNAGAAATASDYLVFLNNDTLPQPGWLDALIQYAEAHPAAAAVGAKLLFTNDTIQHAGVVIGLDLNPHHIYCGFPADHPAVNKSRRFPIVTGACLLVRRGPFVAAGGFDTSFYNGFEDVDLCLRLGEQGHEVHYCHESVLYHLESASRKRTGPQIERASDLYVQRWHPRVQPDDLRYYQADGLLSVSYGPLYPFNLRVSPELALGLASEPDLALEKLLNRRTDQVEKLLREVAVRAVGQPLPTTPGAPPPAPSPQPAAPARSAPPPPPEAQHQADLMHPDVENLVGFGDPWLIGQQFLNYFVAAAGLQPHERVLEVGCGVGRMALALARYLSAAGSYDGFDIKTDYVAWCQEKITPRYPNFRFHHADIANTAYNPGGRYPAAQYRFPFPDGAFDFVCLTSVFTHMLPAGVENYVAEIQRVLRPGGRCLATFFLLDEENERLVDQGQAMFRLPGRHGFYRTELPDNPEAVMSYDAGYVRALFRRHGLTVAEPVQFGNWSGRQHGVIEGQDYVVASKSADSASPAPAALPGPAYVPESSSLPAAVAALRASARVLSQGAWHTLPGGPGQARVSVLIPVKNAAARLEALLRQVLRQRFAAEVEIIAVDSGSTDDTLARLASFQATIIAIEPAAFDHAQARNLLASYARGQYWVYLTQEALPADEHWLANLVAPLQANPLLAGVSSRLIPRQQADPLLYHEVVEQPNGSPERSVLSISSWAEYQRLSPHERRMRLIFATVSAAIRPEVLAHIPFRPVRLIGEDLQWAQDVMLAGYQLQYEPASIVFHSHDYSLAETLQRNVDDGAANYEIVGRRLEAADTGPALLALFYADRRYLTEALHLSGAELDAWQLEAFMRRTMQVVGQWMGSHSADLDPALLNVLSRFERIRGGRVFDLPPSAAEPLRPLPPADLQYRVSGANDPLAFDQLGRQAAEDFGQALARHGRRLADFNAVFDFGCGCGRLLRHLVRTVPADRLSGSDIDADAVAWVQRHYPLVDARANDALPPLSFAAGSFDLVLCYSVFTHLDEAYQDAWLAELQRVTAPAERQATRPWAGSFSRPASCIGAMTAGSGFSPTTITPHGTRPNTFDSTGRAGSRWSRCWNTRPGQPKT